MQQRLNRRTVLGGAAAAAAALAGSNAVAAGPAGCGGPGPVAETTAGRVRGYFEGPVRVFKGVRYGADTSGANRWLPPKKPTPWKGVADAREYGPRAPQLRGGAGPGVPEVWMALGRQQISEDCLFLDVWTPALTGKRPVIVWIHGGGFGSTSGSSPWNDGARLAQNQDVVVVSGNQRLNVFGYLHLAELGGPAYESSGNAGMLDCVAMLEWVRDNIANFGGDPQQVTIAGIAGRVSTLMGFVPAKGLFHRAWNLSGNAMTVQSREQAAADTHAWLQGKGFDGTPTLRDLQALSMEELVSWIGPGAGSGPVVDEKLYPQAAFADPASRLTADVPFVMGSVKTEVSFTGTHPFYPIDEATLRTRLKQYLNTDDAQVAELLALYRRTRAGIDNTYLYLIIASDYWFMSDQALQAQRKAALGAAPAYLYQFEKESTARRGLLHCPHGSDIPYLFDNMAYGAAYTGGGSQALATQMSTLLANFARTGVPAAPGLPRWPAYDPATRAVMIFDDSTRVVNDPRREERLAIAALKARQAAG